MRAKASSLQSVYDAHAEKVKLIAEQLNKAKAEYGENSQQAEKPANRPEPRGQRDEQGRQ